MACKREWLWLYVTDDKYEFPIFIADTSAEMASLHGVDPKSIQNAVRQAEKYGYKSRYKRVPRGNKNEERNTR